MCIIIATFAKVIYFVPDLVDNQQIHCGHALAKSITTSTLSSPRCTKMARISPTTPTCRENNLKIKVLYRLFLGNCLAMLCLEASHVYFTCTSLVSIYCCVQTNLIIFIHLFTKHELVT